MLEPVAPFDHVYVSPVVVEFAVKVTELPGQMLLFCELEAMVTIGAVPKVITWLVELEQVPSETVTA